MMIRPTELERLRAPNGLTRDPVERGVWKDQAIFRIGREKSALRVVVDASRAIPEPPGDRRGRRCSMRGRGDAELAAEEIRKNPARDEAWSGLHRPDPAGPLGSQKHILEVREGTAGEEAALFERDISHVRGLCRNRGWA